MEPIRTASSVVGQEAGNRISDAQVNSGSIPSWFSQTAYSELPDGTRSPETPEAFLLDYNQAETATARLWTFLTNPQVLSFSTAAEYGSNKTFAAAIHDHHYFTSGGRTLQIQGILLDTWQQGKLVEPLIDGIYELTKADLANKRYAPPLLSFVWGDRRFAPCVITEVSWDESGWHSGRAARAVLNFTLIEVRDPKKRADPLVPAEKQGRTSEDKEKEASAKTPPKLPKELTERQRKEGSNAAKEYLRQNQKSLPPALKGVVDSNSYFLSTDEATGAITMLDSNKREIGVVGRWDGREFTQGEKNQWATILQTEQKAGNGPSPTTSDQETRPSSPQT